MEGIVHTYKAHLVVKCFTQTYKVDYEETFSPVTNIRSIRILIAIAAFYVYEIWQIDVKTTFLNGYLDEDIYMVQPEGFFDPNNPRKTGYVFVLNGGTMDWKSSKQSNTAISAIEAEYIADSEETMEVVWIKKFISRLGIIPTINLPIKMFYDNSATLLINNEPRVQRGAIHYHRKDIIMFASVLNWAKLIFLKFTQMNI
nr:retrovirus-related Pol polyprotein from transposon TNT 1-94 [Tanacetum cinerariifolium]